MWRWWDISLPFTAIWARGICEVFLTSEMNEHMTIYFLSMPSLNIKALTNVGIWMFFALKFSFCSF